MMRYTYIKCREGIIGGRIMQDSNERELPIICRGVSTIRLRDSVNTVQCSSSARLNFSQKNIRNPDIFVQEASNRLNGMTFV